MDKNKCINLFKFIESKNYTHLFIFFFDINSPDFIPINCQHLRRDLILLYRRRPDTLGFWCLNQIILPDALGGGILVLRLCLYV